MDFMKISILCFTFLCCSLFFAYRGVNGYSTTNIQSFPYQVTVHVDKNPVCGGAIIGDQWVLTARSCIPANASEVNRVRIRAGTSVLGRGGAYHMVSKMTKFYERASYFGAEDADVALIKVVSPFTYASTIQWISPDVDLLPDDQDIVVSGWGFHNNTAEKHLHKSTVKLIPKDQCEQQFTNIFNLTTEMVCLVPASESDNACIADVGAPISVRGLISAVVTNNEHCWNEGLPLVVTNIGKIGWFIAYTLSEPLLRYGPIF